MVAWKVILFLTTACVPIQLRAQQQCDSGSSNTPWEAFSPEMPFRVITGDSQFDDPRWLHSASVDRLTNSWNHLIQEFRSSKDLFSRDELVTIDARLRHLQDGLLALGLVSIRSTRDVQGYYQSIRELVPNATALNTFFEHKRADNPKIKAFKRLARDANAIAEETDYLSPITPASRFSQP